MAGADGAGVEVRVRSKRVGEGQRSQGAFEAAVRTLTFV